MCPAAVRREDFSIKGGEAMIEETIRAVKEAEAKADQILSDAKTKAEELLKEAQEKVLENTKAAKEQAKSAADALVEKANQDNHIEYLYQIVCGLLRFVHFVLPSE